MRRSQLTRDPRLWLTLALGVWAGAVDTTGAVGQEASPEPNLEVRVVTDEADAMLALLAKRSRNEELDPADWAGLEATEGYQRLKRRAESFGAESFDEGFREWVLEADLGSVDRLRAGVDRWRTLDAASAASKALAYLPPGTSLRAKIYPVLKKTGNSFVFELDRDPAIFMYVSGEASESQLANTLAHELHHVGSVAGCPEEEGDLDERAAAVVRWMGGFAEGIAILAAAGGPEIHPHAGRASREWIVWERDIARFNHDLERIEAFFREILAGELDDEAQRERFFQLINTEEVPQGPFYTVGWKMAALVEQRFGRQAVIEAVCDPRRLLSAYDQIARSESRTDGGSLATWSPELLRAVSPGGAVAAPPPGRVEGTVRRRREATEFGPGDDYVNARDAVHQVWIEGPTGLQITGIGPWKAVPARATGVSGRAGPGPPHSAPPRHAGRWLGRPGGRSFDRSRVEKERGRARARPLVAGQSPVSQM